MYTYQLRPGHGASSLMVAPRHNWQLQLTT
jgi:hypothetical protein